uniref:Ground-like domain-containing protein n=1 Tax=Strongyloides papillosus TaxID=174720 RepID=A0A0N5C9I6_STREA
MALVYDLVALISLHILSLYYLRTKVTVTMFIIHLLTLLLLSSTIPIGESRVQPDNCKSEKLREIILETAAIYPHQYSYQARYMKQQAEERFGNWWSAVIISEKGGYGMSAVYDQYQNTSCEITIYDVFYWLGRTS